MSLNLYMEPIEPVKATNLGGHPLKGLICEAFGEHDGSLREDIVLARAHLPQLQVLLRTHGSPKRGATAEELREGLQQIIDAVERHGAVRLFTEEWPPLARKRRPGVTTMSEPTEAALLASSGLVIDCFAGPGGWDEGVRPLGLRPVGIEWDEWACKTAVAAGHTRVRADVETFPLDQLKGRVTGLIMSPPCPDFSPAGLGAGIEGTSGRLITQVLRWTEELRPRWLACEQVPPCLTYWQEFATQMRGWGYKTWAGVVCAADYGVAQERYRAVLLASLDRQPSRPEPTHAQGGDMDLFGSRAEWISMGEALNLDDETRYRRTRGDGMIERHGPRRDRPVSEPAPTLTSKARSDVWVRPAPTIVTTRRSAMGGMLGRSLAEGGVRVTVQEAAILQSFPADYPWQGSRSKQFEQVGNAVPPRLALHVVAEVLGVQVPHATEAEAAA